VNAESPRWRLGVALSIRRPVGIAIRIWGETGEYANCDQTCGGRGPACCVTGPCGAGRNLRTDGRLQADWYSFAREDYGIRYKSCRAFVIEGLDDRGRILAQQAWNNSYGPNSDIRGMAYMGKSAIIATKQSDGTYKFGDNFTLRLEGNKLVGKFHNKKDSGDHDVLLLKR
jgi:hypothetical protein